MPIGSPRPTAGRPKGSKTLKAAPISKLPVDIRKAAQQSGVTPLEYMLAIMRDENEDPDRRARMAMAAAPYVHARPGDLAQGKKAAAEEASLTAGHGTE